MWHEVHLAVPIELLWMDTPLQGRSGFVKFPSERRDVDTLRMWVRTVAGLA
jgi:hypothetical protein